MNDKRLTLDGEGRYIQGSRFDKASEVAKVGGYAVRKPNVGDYVTEQEEMFVAIVSNRDFDSALIVQSLGEFMRCIGEKERPVFWMKLPNQAFHKARKA